MVRFTAAGDERPVLRCPEDGCRWARAHWPEKVHSALTGHYSHKHPERRPPDRRDARRAAGL